MSEEFFPEFYTEPAETGTYQALFEPIKKAPSVRYFKFIKDTLGLSDEEFRFAAGKKQIPTSPAKNDLKAIYPDFKISGDVFDRAKAAVVDADRVDGLKGILPPIPDGVIYLENEEELSRFFSISKNKNFTLVDKGENIFVYDKDVFLAAADFSKYAYVVEFNQIDHTITISKGTRVKDAEKYLKEAKSFANRAYTLDLPELFDVDLDDKTVSKKFLDETDIEIEKTLRFFEPRGKKKFAYVFKDYDKASTCLRELAQSNNDLELVLLDENATKEAFAANAIEVVEKYYSIRGYKNQKRAIVLGIAKGGGKISKRLASYAKSVCKKYGGATLTKYFTEKYPENAEFSKAFDIYGISASTSEYSSYWHEINAKKASYEDKLLSAHKNAFITCKITPENVERVKLIYNVIEKR